MLEDPAFVKYLEYLRYWEQPQYAKFVHYPHAFYFLEQLRRPEFRKAMQNPRLAEAAHGHQFWHWQKSRTEQVEAAAAAAAAGGTPAPSESQRGADDLDEVMASSVIRSIHLVGGCGVWVNVRGGCDARVVYR